MGHCAATQPGGLKERADELETERVSRAHRESATGLADLLSSGSASSLCDLWSISRLTTSAVAPDSRVRPAEVQLSWHTRPRNESRVLAVAAAMTCSHHTQRLDGALGRLQLRASAEDRTPVSRPRDAFCPLRSWVWRILFRVPGRAASPEMRRAQGRVAGTEGTCTGRGRGDCE